MVNEGRGRLFRRKDDKYLIYVPKDLAKTTVYIVGLSLIDKAGSKIRGNLGSCPHAGGFFVSF
ncbi:MAG: hypothetical protein OEZ35_02575 [Candidatus Bathyarchaeota archaeon]|nr:hypothetical protein [Candidatus Bathyarchaeota archaeon]